MVPTIDTVDYNKRMIAISNNDTTGRWPVKAPYPLPGAILPYNRIIAFTEIYIPREWEYLRNPKGANDSKITRRSCQMECCRFYGKSNSSIHYIAVTAQGSPGTANMYRMHAFKQIDTVLSWAKPIDALVFLDIQVGHSTVKTEVTELGPYLAMFI
jgi:hypothetical protein